MNPYAPPPPPSSSDHAEIESAVRGPAIALIVVAGICLAAIIVSIPIDLFLLAMGDADQAKIVVRLCWGIVLAIASGFVLYGAIQMLRLRDYSVAYAACVVAAIPCVGPCCVLGIPFGIWGIVALHDDNVQRAFR